MGQSLEWGISILWSILSSIISQSQTVHTNLEWDVLRAKYTGSVEEYTKKKEKIGVFVPDVDIGDGPDFGCDDFVVEGEPEPLEADLVLEDDSDVEIVRGVFSSW